MISFGHPLQYILVRTIFTDQYKPFGIYFTIHQYNHSPANVAHIHIGCFSVSIKRQSFFHPFEKFATSRHFSRYAQNHSRIDDYSI